LANDQKVIRFSQLSLIDLPNSTRRRPLKIHGEATCSKLSPSSIARSGESQTRELLRRLRKLDADQLHIMMVVLAAIERGVQ